jgi:PhzF family phenazine biosynthesis protein
MESGIEFWQAAVFCDRGAAGNATGIIFDRNRTNDKHSQRMAQLLGFPDTVFLDLSADSGEWNTRTFSPSEKISFCVQTLLGAHTVLRRKSGESITESKFRTAGRSVSVETDPQRPEVAWLTMPQHDIVVSGEVVDLSSAITVSESQYPAYIVDAGRKRVYSLVPPPALESTVAEPARVQRCCEERKIHGICLFSLTQRNVIASRVFTTSLDGREDVATGGAVAGMFSYLERIGKTLDFHNVWTVHQGVGPDHARGTIYARRKSNAKDVSVGGAVKLLVHGELVYPVSERN